MSTVQDEAFYERFYAEDFPELDTGPVENDIYTSSEYFELQRRAIFQNSWMMITTEREIPEPGDFIVKRVDILNTTIIVVRGKDGVLRAFHNVCSHRCNQLIYECGKGHVKSALKCNFHGWRFALDGSLVGVPEQDRFLELDKKRLGLKKVTVDTWRGFVFIHPKASPDESLHDYLGSLGKQIEAYPFERLQLATSFAVDVNAHWLLANSAFMESYHTRTVHAVSSPNTLFVRASGFQKHGRHVRSTTTKDTGTTRFPFEKLAFKLAAKSHSSPGQIAGADADDSWGPLNPFGDPNYLMDINHIFPINTIFVSNGFSFTYEFWPVAVNRTRFVAKLFLEPPRSWSHRIGQELISVQYREVLMEDMKQIETVQRGLESGAFDSIMLSDQEIKIRYFHHMVASLVGAYVGESA